MRRAISIALAGLLAAGCGSVPAAEQASPRQTPVVQASPPASEAAADAGAVVDKLKAADLGLTRTAVQDEDTDPNNLIGRPNGYVSRASADLPGGDRQGEKHTVDRGLVVEVFPNAEGATRRSEYIQGLLKGNPMLGTEWHYTTAGGRVLVRVGGNVKPSLAKKIEAAVKKM